MDMTQLRYFLTTAETLNYTRAAERLYLSRQALRQALAAVEKEFGTPLFINRRNKLSLTAAGEYLRISGAETLARFDEMTNGMKRFVSQGVRLTVGISQSLFPFMTPELDEILERFLTCYPTAAIRTLRGSNDEMLKAVESGEADCSFVIQMPCFRPGLYTEPLKRFDAIVSYGPHHALKGRRTVNPADLDGCVCIGMGSLEETMRPFYEACRREKIRLCYEVVPDAIDAFYRVAHEETAAFDILKEEIPEYARGDYSILSGYVWEVGLVCREDSKQLEETRIFSRFMRDEYKRRSREQREREERNSRPKGF